MAKNEPGRLNSTLREPFLAYLPLAFLVGITPFF